MRFEDIDFQERSGSKAPGLGLLLPGNYWVHKSHFDEAWKLIHAANPALDWQGEQIAETLCADPDWKYRKCGIRIKLGRCVKYFVDQGMLPLKVANPGKKGKRKYIRK